ncbi:glycoside hydrolase/deacetylase [Choiromyces venosus 120613-1]|uniref:Glycoside hydrolase/deacetylase n=1 Tax=Choiromyces venosus 120613-1 TaxID=1336337 RepID=A0A3N4J2P8_9PEZI|nr:glycoside hydrolase/deacetylase [Choiromyces venosus 120613-1]
MNRPKPGGVPYGQIIKTCKDPGMVALTFDDGPFQYTGRLLDTLKNNGGIHATFFVNGKNAGDLNDQAMKDVLKRMMADGHQIGSHAFSQKSLSPLSETDKISEMVKLEDALQGIVGKKPTYMRPPNLECNGQCMKLMGRMGYHVIGENLDTHDWENVSNMQVSKDIVSKAVDGADSKKNNYIVLAHDIHEATVEQLAKHMIDKFKEKGYRCKLPP